ncbi:MAG TPA: DinB family protein [Dehalococcoidia bacterium]|nr:DinB family protein [Dehalococcoidia bacterium]
MRDHDSQAWVLKALRETGSTLLSELAACDEDLLRWRPAEGEWSLKEIAAHLRDAEELALAQLNAFVAGAARPLPAWDVDLLPHERDYQEEAIDRLLASFRDLRRETTYLLWGLTDSDWAGSAEHPYRGEVTLGETAHELAQHDLEHLWQVRQLKERLRETVAARDDD